MKYTAAYDSNIVTSFHKRWIGSPEQFKGLENLKDKFGQHAFSQCRIASVLRYGENGHQGAALCVNPDQVGHHSTL